MSELDKHVVEFKCWGRPPNRSHYTLTTEKGRAKISQTIQKPFKLLYEKAINGRVDMIWLYVIAQYKWDRRTRLDAYHAVYLRNTIQLRMSNH